MRSSHSSAAIKKIPLWRRIGFARGQIVRDLQNPPIRSATPAKNRPSCSPCSGRHRLTNAVIAVLAMGAGYTLGVYYEPIQEALMGFAKIKAVNADPAYAAYTEKRYATALRLARPLAVEGNARAQSLLGNLYYRGRGVPQNHNEALRWFRLAADQEDADAQFYVGLMFSEGQGVPQDHTEAARWFRRAANLGDAHAQYNLGVAYASSELGKPDNVSAHMWFNLAAAHFPFGSAQRRAAVNSRDLIAKKLTPAQVVEAEQRAREWKHRSNEWYNAPF